MKTNCIICAEELENWDEAYPEGKEQVHPIGGTVFRTYGNYGSSVFDPYGSSVFDPMDASYLDIVVCDKCLKARLDRTYEGMNEEYRAQLDAEMAEIIHNLDLYG